MLIYIQNALKICLYRKFNAKCSKKGVTHKFGLGY